MSERHVPVLVDAIVTLAEGCSRIVDCTIGDGGHARRLLRQGVEMLAIDRDRDALAVARESLESTMVTWLNLSFGDPAALEAITRFEPDFVLFDLGVSSRQLDTDGRGFSFRRDVPLDMRMTQSGGPTGADLLNTLSPEELTRVFRDFADEPRAKRLANQIVRRRNTCRFVTSDDLVNAVRGALGPRTGPADFARLFQAVRIEVNGEIRALEEAVPNAFDSLVPGGTVAVISYHSVEDRVVKHQFREWSRRCICPAEVPVCTCRGRPLGEHVTRKPICPSAAEIASNPRARSAKLRAFRKANAA